MVKYQWKLQQRTRDLLRPRESVPRQKQERVIRVLFSTQPALSAECRLQRGAFQPSVEWRTRIRGSHRKHPDDLSVRQAFQITSSRTVRQFAAPASDGLSGDV